MLAPTNRLTRWIPHPRVLKAPAAARIPNASTAAGGVVGRMVVLRNGRFLCRGRGCHTVYDAKDVIDPQNVDYALYVR